MPKTNASNTYKKTFLEKKNSLIFNTMTTDTTSKIINLINVISVYYIYLYFKENI